MLGSLNFSLFCLFSWFPGGDFLSLFVNLPSNGILIRCYVILEYAASATTGVQAWLASCSASHNTLVTIAHEEFLPALIYLIWESRLIRWMASVLPPVNKPGAMVMHAWALPAACLGCLRYVPQGRLTPPATIGWLAGRWHSFSMFF